MEKPTILRGVAREVIKAESVTFWLERPNEARVRVRVPPTRSQTLVEGQEVEVKGVFNVNGEFDAVSVERMIQPAPGPSRISVLRREMFLIALDTPTSWRSVPLSGNKPLEQSVCVYPSFRALFKACCCSH